MQPIKVHIVNSYKQPGVQYRVAEFADGRLACSCPDYEMRHAGKGPHCKHIRRIIASVKVAALAAAGVPSMAPEAEG